MTAPIALTLSRTESAIESVLTAWDGLTVEQLADAVAIGTDGAIDADDVRASVDSLCAAGRLTWDGGVIWKEKRG